MTDQFTTAVVQAALDSAAEEMFEVLRKTAMNQNRRLIDIAQSLITAANLLGP